MLLLHFSGAWIRVLWNIDIFCPLDEYNQINVNDIDKLTKHGLNNNVLELFGDLEIVVDLQDGKMKPLKN